MTCPSCGYPRPDRIADSCGYCEAYPEVRGEQPKQFKFKAGDTVQVICDGFSGEIAEIKWIEPKGYYPYAVWTTTGIVYFAEGELEEIVV